MKIKWLQDTSFTVEINGKQYDLYFDAVVDIPDGDFVKRALAQGAAEEVKSKQVEADTEPMPTETQAETQTTSRRKREV